MQGEIALHFSRIRFYNRNTDVMYAKMYSQGIRPSTIVDYARIPYIYGPGNVRVTLDFDIRIGLRCVDLLNPDVVTIPAGDALIILEVKWDELCMEDDADENFNYSVGTDQGVSQGFLTDLLAQIQ